MVYAWTFIAATPPFQCKLPFDDSPLNNLTNQLISSYIPSETQCRETQKSISLKECQRCFQVVNNSAYNIGSISELSPCRSFAFDRTYYQSTIVEDWSMVCDRVPLKSTVQIVFFVGYMVGSLVFGVLSDKLGRRPIMGVSFILMFIGGIVCAIAPQDFIGHGTSYPLFAFGRFLLACATRGIGITGFVMGMCLC
ncbi:unnamed protein product [Rotaria sordida]|uniref:Major facilitator superfamily (MFS) profile domain-containing protein n=1 Tax=Rotaria sordida TaxID=392033 RepID=A0A815MIT3_9BILA|nr:unnamed protein product [Rotaria sordida]CAF1423841.1 unnamed protein product [Rotaria sordida]